MDASLGSISFRWANEIRYPYELCSVPVLVATSESQRPSSANTSYVRNSKGRNSIIESALISMVKGKGRDGELPVIGDGGAVKVTTCGAYPHSPPFPPRDYLQLQISDGTSHPPFLLVITYRRMLGSTSTPCAKVPKVLRFISQNRAYA
ncbi:hypothetical protein HGRIS_005344 [Hohenbuehelia grisea]|uniref:Uncharacterized protein n=1 Tax=Hohenbuehelia grisea TaxID=104357 RepID=A0ABR3JF77_9AGAR